MAKSLGFAVVGWVLLATLLVPLSAQAPVQILYTYPINGEVAVPLDTPIAVAFSGPMNTTGVMWTITPAIALSSLWDGTGANLTLDHAIPFADCTVYTVSISSPDLVPGPVPNPWWFETACIPPHIVSTSPAHGEYVTDLLADIVVTFSEPMNTSTVTWTINPAVAFASSWNGARTVLTLSHSWLFVACAAYTIGIYGQDDAGWALVPGPVPNPWTFYVGTSCPTIVATSQPDGATGVPLDDTIVVWFSEAMNATTVTWMVTPTIGGVNASWPDPATLEIDHSVPFAPCMNYTVEVTAGEDLDGYSLAPGPVPNPWRFRTWCPVPAPPGLVLSSAPPNDILLDWRDVPGTAEYRVYESSDPLAPFPSGWNLVGAPAASEFTAAGDLTDGLGHYYLVRAFDGTRESANSTMGVKPASSFAFSPTRTNVFWLSLPQGSPYARASDLAADLGTANVDVIGKWDPVQQRSTIYYFARGKWRGTDFVINAGDGLYLGVKQDFDWPVVGTEEGVTLTFTLNPAPKTNVNWVGIPYASAYATASDIADELGPAKVVEVGAWDPVTQSALRWSWDGAAWTGMDFALPRGGGVYLVVVASFAWIPSLITPPVP